MALVTPEEWLPVLAQRLDRRAPEISRLRSYTDGNAPLPEMGPNTRATWLAFQKKSRTNFGGIACQSHANRIRWRGVRVGDDAQSEVSLAARRIARDNRLAMQISDAVWDMLTARTGYLVAGVDDGRALITAERPEQFYAEPDPVRPWRTRAALKVWRDTVAQIDYALVWVIGGRQRFTRASYTMAAGSTDKIVRSVSSGGWVADGPLEPYDGNPPVWIFDRRDGMGLIEPHLDLIDRINLGKLQRLSTSAIQAFKQRALKRNEQAGGESLPETDPQTGQKIDWSAALEAAPGALWDLPIGIDIWESGSTDIRPLLDGEKHDAREFSAVTGTSVSTILPDSANQSATGAMATTQQQVDACVADIERIRLAVAACILVSLRIEGYDVNETIEADFENPAWVTLAEMWDAYSKAIASGMSVPTAQKQILGWSQDQIDEDERNRRREAARAALETLAPAASAAEGGGDRE